MCKWNKYGDTRIDPCMRGMIDALNGMIESNGWEILMCCCGHGKYPMSIVCQHETFQAPFDLISNENLHGKRFYKRDKKGYYFLKEIHKEKK